MVHESPRHSDGQATRCGDGESRSRAKRRFGRNQCSSQLSITFHRNLQSSSWWSNSSRTTSVLGWRVVEFQVLPSRSTSEGNGRVSVDLDPVWFIFSLLVSKSFQGSDVSNEYSFSTNTGSQPIDVIDRPDFRQWNRSRTANVRLPWSADRSRSTSIVERDSLFRETTRSSRNQLFSSFHSMFLTRKKI